MSLYEDLGVAPDADAAAIKAAHRRAVRKHHPDNQESGDRARFELVQRAYIILSDPARRERYDRTGEADERVDQTIGQIFSLVVQALDAVVAKVGRDFERTDMVSAMINHLKTLRMRVESAGAEAREVEKKIQQMLDRFTYGGTEGDPIGTALRSRIREAQGAARNAEARLPLFDAAIAEVKCYTFAFTPRQTPESSSQRNFDDAFARALRELKESMR